MAVFALLVVNFHNRLLGWLISEQPAVSVCSSFEKSINNSKLRSVGAFKDPPTCDVWQENNLVVCQETEYVLKHDNLQILCPRMEN